MSAQKASRSPSLAEELANAELAYTTTSNKFRELVELYERLKLAQQLAAVGEKLDDRSEVAIARAGELLAKARRHPRKVAQEIEEAFNDIPDARAAMVAAQEKLRDARAARADEVAVALRPRHRAAARKIAKALETLSIALAEEEDVRVELAKLVPNVRSRHLPDVSSGLWVANLSLWHSAAAAWARDMRAAGFIE